MNYGKILIVFLTCCYSAESRAQGYTLHGKVKGVDKGWAFIRHRQTGQTDSCRIINGEFSASGAVNAPEFCSFGLSVNGTMDYYLSFFLENGVFTMKADKAKLNDISITFTGSSVEKEFQGFQRRVHHIGQLHYSPAQADSTLEQLATRYTLKHRDSYISAFALNSFVHDPSKLAALYALMAPEIQLSYFGKRINQQLNGHE